MHIQTRCLTVQLSTTLVLAATFGLLSGCGNSVDSRVAAYRQSLLLTAEPDDVETIESVRENAAAAVTDAALIVRIGNKEFTDWRESDKAIVVGSEAFPGSTYNVGPNHDPSTCPFCKGKWKTENSLAFVEFIDHEGRKIPVDALTLLQVSEGDTIVVRGRASILEDGYLYVAASGVFVRHGS